MISRIRVRHFKAFESQSFDLSDHIVLAGPNNSGKTTLLQAIVVWNLALQRWRFERGGESKGKERTGVPITRKDFTAIPLREMNLLWTNTSTALRKQDAGGGKAGHPRVMEIELEGRNGQDPWSLTFEFRYQSSEQIYARPKSLASVQGVDDIGVVHVPPFSGIGVQETRYDPPYQNLLIGQGKPGDILRNLLLEIHQKDDQSDWNSLCGQVERVFGYSLLPPRYEGLPFIVCEYLPGRAGGKKRSEPPPLDISCAGSGFHQVLMLLAFFYARPSSVLLLDEPDAHLHVVLQKQIYDLLRQVAVQRSCQLVIATHAEVLIDGTSPELILSFLGKPHRLITDTEREQVREALKRLQATEILISERSAGVLYVEGESDFDLLRAWARVLDHPSRRWFEETPFWHSNRGRNPREARAHFFALRAIKPEIRGLLLLDGDNRGLPDREVGADGLTIARWERYEAESYLVHPEALFRYVEQQTLPLFAKAARDFLLDQIPPNVAREPLKHSVFSEVTPASKILLPAFFGAANLSLPKQEYYIVAEQMKPSEIPDEIGEKLDLIASAFGMGG